MSNYRPVFQFKRGDHICVFYQDQKTLSEIVAQYLAEGLRNGERCFTAQPAQFIPPLFQALAQREVDYRREMARGALEIHTEDEVYFANGRFEPESMMPMLERFIEDAVRQGFTGFRTAGEMCWTLDPKYGEPNRMCDQLISYEGMVDRSYAEKPAIGMCQYPLHRFPPAVLRKVLQYHRQALEERMVCSNHSALTISSGKYSGDIVTDRLRPGSAFHYVVQKSGNNEVLGWGQESTMEAAIATTRELLSEFSSDGGRASQ